MKIDADRVALRLAAAFLCIAPDAATAAERGAALAYIDPGAGSLLLQGLLAALAGAAVAAKAHWKRIKRFVGRGDDPEQEPPGSSGDACRDSRRLLSRP